MQYVERDAREKRNVCYVAIEKARHEGEITWFSLLSKTYLFIIVWARLFCTRLIFITSVNVMSCYAESTYDMQ